MTDAAADNSRHDDDLATATPTSIGESQLRSRAQYRADSLGRDEPVRSWVPVGTLDAGPLADVDGAGTVALRDESWTLECWIGSEERWHVPATEPSVRQRRVEGTPVLETLLRAPGGDISQRVFGARVRVRTTEESGVVFEVENTTGLAVALAIVIRPRTLDGTLGDTPRRISVDGPTVSIDGEARVHLSRMPARVVGAPQGELGHALSAESRQEQLSRIDATSIGDGSAPVEGAVIVPLAHTATIRGVITPRVRAKRRDVAEPVGADWTAPQSESVAAGWAVHLDTGAEFHADDPLVDDVARMSQVTLLMSATDHFGVVPSRPVRSAASTDSAGARIAAITESLVRIGHTDVIEPIARALVDLQGLRKPVRMPDGSDGSVALLWAASALLRSKKSEQWADDLVGPVAKVLSGLEKWAKKARPGEAPPSSSSVRLISALAHVAAALNHVGQPGVAATAVELAHRVSSLVAPDDAKSAQNVDDPTSSVAVAASLLALRECAPSDERSTLVGLACRAGDPGLLPDGLIDNVPAGVWGCDPAAVAARLLLLADIVAVDDFGGLNLLWGMPTSWGGRSLQFSGWTTAWGELSYAVRWHGERLAILWEITPHPAIDPTRVAPTLRAGAIDPAWSASGWSGEGLLTPHASFVPEPQETGQLEAEHPDTLEILGTPRRIDVSWLPSTDEEAPSDTSDDDAASGEGLSFS